MKTVNIKGKEYVMVNERITAFRKTFPNHCIVSEIVYHSTSEVVELNGEQRKKPAEICFKTVIMDDKDRIVSTGYAMEKEGSSNINKTSYVENCETSAVGRALGMFGVGLGPSIATAEEVANAINNQ